MIITCPSCSARYPVDAAAFSPAGRKVKCAKCGNRWHQDPPDDLPKTVDGDEAEEAAVAPGAQENGAQEDIAEEEFDEDLEDADEGPSGDLVAFSQVETVSAEAQSKKEAKSKPRVVKTKTSRPGLLRRAVGWVLLFAVVGGSVFVTYEYREQIVKIWPATARLYAMLNKPVNLRGMEFQNVVYEHQFENGLPVLAISGEVVNVAARELSVPKVRVGLRDGKEREIYHWTFSVPQSVLSPMEVAKFVTRLSSPPLEAQDLEIRFVTDEEAAAAGQGGAGQEPRGISTPGATDEG